MTGACDKEKPLYGASIAVKLKPLKPRLSTWLTDKNSRRMRDIE